MITKVVLATKKAPSQHQDEAQNCTPRYHPNFRLKANTLAANNGACRTGLTGARPFIRSAPKGNAQRGDTRFFQPRKHSLWYRIPACQLHHRIYVTNG